MIDFLRLYATEVGALMSPGETVLDMGRYREPPGDASRLERTPDEPGAGVASADRLVTGFDPLVGGIQTDARRIDWFLAGSKGSGSPGSIAGQLWRGAQGRGAQGRGAQGRGAQGRAAQGRGAQGRAAQGRSETFFYAVTNRRLLLLAARGVGPQRAFRVAWEVPRSAVAAAAPRGRLLQAGRVEVAFTDGSTKAWTTATFSAARARTLVAALTTALTSMGY